MKPLILSGESGVSLMDTDLADLVVPFIFRFVCGPLPSPNDLATYLAARSDKHGPGSHWSDYGSGGVVPAKAVKIAKISG
jgi:hypothetical protein